MTTYSFGEKGLSSDCYEPSKAVSLAETASRQTTGEKHREFEN